MIAADTGGAVANDATAACAESANACASSCAVAAEREFFSPPVTVIAPPARKWRRNMGSRRNPVREGPSGAEISPEGPFPQQALPITLLRRRNLAGGPVPAAIAHKVTLPAPIFLPLRILNRLEVSKRSRIAGTCPRHPVPRHPYGFYRALCHHPPCVLLAKRKPPRARSPRRST